MYPDLFVHGLTFFFVFAIVYGSLEVSGIFRRRINTLIALVFAFFSITSEPVVSFIYQILPYAAVFFLIFFFVGFIFSFIKKGTESDWTLGVIVAGFILLILSGQSDFLNNIFSLDENLFNAVITLAALLLIAVIFYGAYKSGK